MSIPTKPLKLVRFRWNLKNLPAQATFSDLPKSYSLKPAESDDYENILIVIKSSYSLDPVWSGNGMLMNNFILPGIKNAFHGDKNHCMIITHGHRIIAASVFNPEPVEGIHLISGPCVLMEYRNRGFGSMILNATLAALRELGVTEAIGQTRPNTPSAKFLFPKFGGTEIVPTPTELAESSENPATPA